MRYKVTKQTRSSSTLSGSLTIRDKEQILTWTWNDCLFAYLGTCCVSVICHANFCYPSGSDYGYDCTSVFDPCRGYETYYVSEIENVDDPYFYFVIYKMSIEYFLSIFYIK